MATLTLGLQNLRRQVDEAFPDRDRTTDGWIGNEAHQAKTSGHNPDDTAGSKPAWNNDPDNLSEVRAWDMDKDLGVVAAQVLVDHVRQLPGLASVLRYMIWDHHEYHARNGFVPIPYTGSDPHTNHVHFEGAWTQAADTNTSFDFRLEEIPMALTAADKTWLAATIDKAATAAAERVWATKLADPYDKDGEPRKLAAGAWLQYVPSRGQVDAARVEILAALPKS